MGTFFFGRLDGLHVSSEDIIDVVAGRLSGLLSLEVSDVAFSSSFIWLIPGGGVRIDPPFVQKCLSVLG